MDRELLVAIVAPYPLDTERLSGVEVAIVYVQQELLRYPGIRLHIVTCNEGISEPQTRVQGRLSITYLPRAGLGRITWHKREVAQIVDALRKIQPDIVHAHTSGLYAGAALACPFPSVLTVHGIAAGEARLAEGWRQQLRGWLDAQYERWVMGRTQDLMLITPYVEQVFQGIFQGRSYLVENACDRRFFDVPWRPVKGRLLFAGPVIPRKGVLPMLKALCQVRQTVPEAHIHIAGSLSSMSEYARACQDYAQAQGMGDAVSFLGHLTQERVLEEYGACEAFVLPSFQETAPMVIEQSMAVGMPSIATHAGGVPWMLEDGVTGWTLPVPATAEGDSQALAEAILRVLEDPQGAKRMGQRAREEAERRFLPAAVAEKTLQVYEQVIARHSGQTAERG